MVDDAWITAAALSMEATPAAADTLEIPAICEATPRRVELVAEALEAESD